MKRTKLTVLLSAALVAMLSGCNQQPAYQQAQYAPQPQVGAAPVIVNQAPTHSGVGDMLMGGALGYMLGRSGSGSGHSGDVNRTTVNKTVVNKTVVNKTVIVQNNHPAPVAAPAPTSRFGAPTSYANAYKSVPTPQARPSYSSARSTSSFRRR